MPVYSKCGAAVEVFEVERRTRERVANLGKYWMFPMGGGGGGGVAFMLTMDHEFLGRVER